MSRSNIKKTLLIVISVGAWLGFLGLHTFTFLSHYDQHAGALGYILPALLTMGLTLLLWNFLKPEEDWNQEDYEEDPEEEYESPEGKTLHTSLLMMLMLTVLFLAVLILELWKDVLFYSDTIYITFGTVVINRKYLFDPFLLLIFPLWIQVIMKDMSRENCRFQSVVSGCTQILALTLMSFLIFMQLYHVWMINLAVMECLIVAAGIGKYLWPRARVRGKALRLFLVYVLLWIGLLSLVYVSGESLSGYTYGGEWSEYQENVLQLLAEASSFGTSSALAHDLQVREFLRNRSNYLLSALYHWGGVAAGGIVVGLLLFLVVTRRMLGRRIDDNENSLVYQAAWWTLAIRVAVCIPYSFGLLPLPIAPPFAGRIGIYTDTAALGLLLSCAMEELSGRKAFRRQLWAWKEAEED